MNLKYLLFLGITTLLLNKFEVVRGQYGGEDDNDNEDLLEEDDEEGAPTTAASNSPVNNIISNWRVGNVTGIVDQALAINAPPPVRNFVVGIMETLFGLGTISQGINSVISPLLVTTPTSQPILTNTISSLEFDKAKEVGQNKGTAANKNKNRGSTTPPPSVNQIRKRQDIFSLIKLVSPLPFSKRIVNNNNNYAKSQGQSNGV